MLTLCSAIFESTLLCSDPTANSRRVSLVCTLVAMQFLALCGLLCQCGADSPIVPSSAELFRYPVGWVFGSSQTTSGAHYPGLVECLELA